MSNALYILRNVHSNTESENTWSILKCLMHSTFCARYVQMHKRTSERCIDRFIRLVGKFVLLFMFNHIPNH